MDIPTARGARERKEWAQTVVRQGNILSISCSNPCFFNGEGRLGFLSCMNMTKNTQSSKYILKNNISGKKDISAVYSTTTPWAWQMPLRTLPPAEMV